MEELEPPVEHLHEAVHHEAHHSGEKWVSAVALSTAILAAFAAVAALRSGFHANSAVLDNIKANDFWSYYQAKNVKATILEGRVAMFQALEKPVKSADTKKIAEEHAKMDDYKAKATAKDLSSDEHFQRHERLSYSVTLFQVAVAICAIAVLTKRQWFWMIGLTFGVAGLCCLVWGELIPAPPEKEEAEATAAEKPSKEAKEPKGEKDKSDSSADSRAPHDRLRSIVEDSFYGFSRESCRS